MKSGWRFSTVEVHVFKGTHSLLVHVNRRLHALSSHLVELEGRSFRVLEEYARVLLARCIIPRTYQPLWRRECLFRCPAPAAHPCADARL
jgi:hypothetical protein